MPITAGSRLGPYEIVAPLGAGGMGEVWRARDTRLDRSVAIKMLPAEFAQNAQLRLRLEREARAISQLNHPNICTLYDVGDGYLVMELVDGESLADRLSKGPLPLEQVLRYGIEIATALDRAHKAGIVHRDLKPGNVMITKSGTKLLDFGLAKPVEGAPVAALTSLRTERRSLTEEGTIVGTFQYMAPEQLEGADVDHRADLFALGALLYEMATGRRAFQGKSRASLIASILTSEPPAISAVQPMTPAALDRIVRTCLAKEPDDRFQSAHDVALELRWVTEAPAAQPLAKRRRDVVAWSVAGALAAALAVLGMFTWSHARMHVLAAPVRLSILPPEGAQFDFLQNAGPPAISPDGAKVVFRASKDSRRALWLRRLDNAAAQMLPGSENAIFPFWSPDSRNIAFFADGKLKRMEISGGAPVELCDVADGRGGSWSADGTIIFGARFSPIYRVSSSGGSPVAVTTFDAAQHDLSHRWPLFLPDGRHFLFLASPLGSEDPANTICVGSLDGKMRKRVIAASSQPLYFDGHLLFVREQILMALRFDPKKLEGSGEPMALGEQQIERDVIYSRSVVSLSAAGTLLYQMGEGTRPSQLGWFDRSGKPLGTIGAPDLYAGISLARDARFVVFSLRATPTSNLWMYDLQRAVRTRITFGASRDGGAQVSPDGTKLLYISTGLKGGSDIRVRDLATGAERTLVTNDRNLNAPAWSRDGQTISFARIDARTRADIWMMSLADGKARPYVVTDAVENQARISPDGRWMAYQSNESGRAEVYVAPIPPTGAKWQISAAGGTLPRWRGDGKELFYVSGDLKLSAVPITLGATPVIGAAQALFPLRPVSGAVVVYDQTDDGQRFLVNSRVGDDPPPQALMVVEHFDNELRAATARR